MVKKSFNPLALGLVLLVLAVIIIILAMNASTKDNYPPDDLPPKDRISCPEKSDETVFCPEIYSPVCGYVQVECVRAPCTPIPETFSNSCYACANERVLYYTEGEC